MSIGEQTKPSRAGVEGFKQAVAQLKGPMQGFDLLERMGRLPALTRLQLPLVDFDPFAAAALSAESPAPWQALPVKASENGSGGTLDASQIRERSPSASSVRSDPPGQSRPSHRPFMDSRTRPHIGAAIGNSDRPAVLSAPPKRERAGHAVSPRRHPTATGRIDRGEKQPAGPAPVFVSEPDRLNADAVAGARHSCIRSCQAADPSPIRRNNTPAGSSSGGLQEIGHGSPLATALKQLDEVTSRLLALNIRSRQNSPSSRNRPSPPDPSNAERTPIDIAPPHAGPALPANHPSQGRNSSPGKYGSTSIPRISTEVAQPKVIGSSGGDCSLREHSVMNAAERRHRFRADGHPSAISPTMALLDKLASGIQNRSASSSPGIGDAPRKNPLTRTFEEAPDILPPNVRVPLKPHDVATMGAAQAIDSLGPIVDEPALMRHQRQDTHLVAERLTDLINDVLVSQARRHGVDV
jgi:hypothetical protein